jgi:hypothetical protein
VVVPKEEDDILKVRQIQVLADGACDAMGLVFFEASRGELKSSEWEARQLRKVYGVLKACDEHVQERKGDFLVNGEFSVADVSALVSAPGKEAIGGTEKSILTSWCPDCSRRHGWHDEYGGEQVRLDSVE